MAAISPTPFSSASGQQTSNATVITVTLPTYTTGDFLVLIMARNQAESAAFTYSAAVTTATELPTAGAGSNRRLTAVQIVPNGTGQASFTVTSVTTSLWTWWIGNYRGASTTLTVNTAVNSIGNSTSSSIAASPVSLGYVATGNEVLISAGAVNSTATWTTDAGSQFHTTANNAALMVDVVNVTAGALTATPLAMDRANNGTSRNQNSLALVLQQAPGGTINLLTNPSFEAGATLATGWTDEHTTATQATYSLTATGSNDGAVAQKFVYTGVSGDGGTAKTELFQSPVTGMVPGNYLTFSCWLSGSLTGTYAFIGIEGFTAASGYISESDTNVVTLTGTPVQYTASYLCPATTDHVAVYVQAPSIGTGVSVSVTMDKATLTIGPGPASETSFFALF